jgi:hypothetical protein
VAIGCLQSKLPKLLLPLMETEKWMDFFYAEAQETCRSFVHIVAGGNRTAGWCGQREVFPTQP